MDSDLMSPSRIQCTKKDRIILRLVDRNASELCQSILSVFIDDPLIRIVTVLADRLVDDFRVIDSHLSLYESQVVPSDLLIR